MRPLSEREPRFVYKPALAARKRAAFVGANRGLCTNRREPSSGHFQVPCELGPTPTPNPKSPLGGPEPRFVYEPAIAARGALPGAVRASWDPRVPVKLLGPTRWAETAVCIRTGSRGAEGAQRGAEGAQLVAAPCGVLSVSRSWWCLELTASSRPPSADGLELRPRAGCARDRDRARCSAGGGCIRAGGRRRLARFRRARRFRRGSSRPRAGPRAVRRRGRAR